MPVSIAMLEKFQAETGTDEYEPAAVPREFAARGKPLHGWRADTP